LTSLAKQMRTAFYQHNIQKIITDSYFKHLIKLFL